MKSKKFHIQAHFILLCFADINFFFFYKLKVCGDRLSKSIGAIFPISFAPFVCLCDILVILSMFQTFSSLLLYLFRWSVMLLLTKGLDDG